MRAIAIAILLAACGGKTPPSTVDADPLVCFAAGSCPLGPNCGDKCCGVGEHCVAGACHCGTGNACGPGDQCEAAGPMMINGCGTFCCGATSPCPQ